VSSTSASTLVMLQSGRLPVPRQTVVYRALPEGGVLLATDVEVYFGVNEVGARVWELLPPRTSSLDELCAALHPHYPDVSLSQLKSDVEEMLQDLLASGLVVDDAEAPACSDAPGIS
jgi:hypothetical protein